MRPVAKSRWRRLILAQTAIDFWGRRRVWLGISALLIVASVVSLHRSRPHARHRLRGRRVVGRPGRTAVHRRRRPPGARRQRDLDATAPRSRSATPTAATSSRSRSTTSPRTSACKLQEAFAKAAGVDPADVSVASVSATWGAEITRKAVQALVVFLVLIAVYISIRFEWRMALDGDHGDDPRRRSSASASTRSSGSRSRRRPWSPSSPCSATRCTTRSSCSTASATTNAGSRRPG